MTFVYPVGREVATTWSGSAGGRAVVRNRRVAFKCLGVASFKCHFYCITDELRKNLNPMQSFEVACEV